MHKTRQEKEVTKSIEKMFEGVNDDYLKAVLLVAYGGESKEILKFYEDDEKKFYQERLEKMEIEDPSKVVLSEEEKIEILNEKINEKIE